MRTLSDVMTDLSPEQREAVDRKAKRLIKAEALRQLRALSAMTQQELAEATGISQHNISRLERREDMLVSTLASYVEGLGGRLRLIAEIPGLDESLEIQLAHDAAKREKPASQR